jgi:hypothetical protein
VQNSINNGILLVKIVKCIGSSARALGCNRAFGFIVIGVFYCEDFCQQRVFQDEHGYVAYMLNIVLFGVCSKVSESARFIVSV